AVMSLCRLCKEVVWALYASTWAFNVISGAASICRMAFTVEVTSMPLPEVFVAEFRMALTASWMADVWFEFVEVVEVCPSSWLSDSVVEPVPKLDRSELIELVLIPLLLCPRQPAARARARVPHHGVE